MRALDISVPPPARSFWTAECAADFASLVALVAENIVWALLLKVITEKRESSSRQFMPTRMACFICSSLSPSIDPEIVADEYGQRISLPQGGR